MAEACITEIKWWINYGCDIGWVERYPTCWLDDIDFIGDLKFLAVQLEIYRLGRSPRFCAKKAARY